MLTLDEARAAILAQIAPTTDSERVALRDAIGRVLAEDVHARVDHPAFDNSAMDGYALRAADLADTDTLPVAGESRCGRSPPALTPATVMRIFTGAPLPAGADAIAIQENVARVGANARISGTVKGGQHIRRRGEDFVAGTPLYRRGSALRIADLGVLATAGHAEVPVCRRPRAIVFATGDELCTLDRPLAPGQVYESNRQVTLAQLQAAGADVTDGGVIPDTLPAVTQALKAAQDFDFIITSGGASVGDHDLVNRALSEIGQVYFWKVRIKPGKPVAFGRIGRCGHFFALPGNPVSSLVTFKLFVEPAVLAWQHAASEWVEFDAVALNSFTREPGRMEFLRAHLSIEAGAWRVQALAQQGSHMIGALRATNGLIKLEADVSGFVLGERVRVLPLHCKLGVGDPFSVRPATKV